MSAATGRPEADRAAFREFVRHHHPDVGGDPDRFAAGLAEFDRKRRRPEPRDRYDAPVVHTAPLTGIRGLVHRFRRWRARRRRPSRVE